MPPPPPQVIPAPRSAAPQPPTKAVTAPTPPAGAMPPPPAFNPSQSTPPQPPAPVDAAPSGGKASKSEAREIARLKTENQRLTQLVQRLEQEKLALQQQSRPATEPRAQKVARAAQPRKTSEETDVSESANADKPKRLASRAKAEERISDYRIKAVVEGRAWVARSDSTDPAAAFSVAVGDPIPGEGAVTKIDPENGIVRTTTTTIR